LAFWIPSLKIAFISETDPSHKMVAHILYWEAITVLAGLRWVTLVHHGTEEKPFWVTVRSDSSNTVNMFNLLRALPPYNPILIDSADLLLHFNIDLRVVHISGSKNSVADALSRNDLELAYSLCPELKIYSMETPQTTMG
ncbi:hypothetical protein GYMLUDRAFT_124777, partial [Collybiopsis luxurians FD-317 M1]